VMVVGVPAAVEVAFCAARRAAICPSSAFTCDMREAMRAALSVGAVPKVLSTALVLGPTPPRASMPWAVWNFASALAVRGSK
jgi:hypothetical protein